MNNRDSTYSLMSEYSIATLTMVTRSKTPEQIRCPSINEAIDRGTPIIMEIMHVTMLVHV